MAVERLTDTMVKVCARQIAYVGKCCLEKGLAESGKDESSIKSSLKSADWKVMLATLLKQKTSAVNAWITGQLNMGTPDAVSRYVSEFRASGGYDHGDYKDLTTKVMK